MPYLQHTLGCIGLADAEVIRVEAQSFGPEAAAQGLAQAMRRVDAAVLPARAA